MNPDILQQSQAQFQQDNPGIMGGSTLAQTTNPQMTATPQPQPNFWEKILPTAGSVLGMLGGSLLDPFLGPLGTVGGGAAGSALGQELENKLAGTKDSTLGSAVSGGIGAGIGLGAGKLLSGAGDALAGKAASAEGQAAQQALDSQWKVVPENIRRAFDFNTTADTLGKYGIDFTPESIAQVAPKITGGDGAIASDLVRSAMEKSPTGVDLTGSMQLANNIANSPELATAGTTVGKAFANSINNILGLGRTGVSMASLPASDVFQAQQALEKLAYQKGSNPALANAYRDMAKALDGNLTSSGVNDVLANESINPEDLQALQQISPQLAQDLQQSAQTSVGALRSFQRPFVQANNLSNAFNDYSEGKLASEPIKVNSPEPKGIVGKMISTFGGGGNSALGRMAELGGVGDALLMGHPATGLPIAAIGAMMENPGAAGSVLSGAATAGGGVLPMLGGQLAAHAPSFGGTMDSGNTMQPQAPNQDPNIAREMAIASLFGMPEFADALGQSQKAQGAESALHSIQQLYAQAGGGHGFGGGLLSNLSGLIPGSSANQYNREKVQLAAAISQATGQPIASVLASLPSLMAGGETADTQFGNLQGQLSPLAAPGALNLGGGMPTSSILSGLAH